MAKPDLGAAILLVLSPHNIPFVRNPRRRGVLWRLPGGHIEGGETPEEAASRETREETGLIIPASSIHIVGSELRKDNHTRYLCVARVDHLDGVLRTGNGGEETDLFSAHEALYNDGFLPDHRRIIRPFLEEEVARQVAYVESVR